jgi:hypothetical protein
LATHLSLTNSHTFSLQICKLGAKATKKHKI